MDAFGWDSREQAALDIAETYRRLCADAHVDPQQVILAEASQGGAVALELALGGYPVPAWGFILAVPAIHDIDVALANAESAPRCALRRWVVTGERDYGRDHAIALGERLNAGGIPCQVDVVPGLGHDFPSDFDARLPAALSDMPV